jgi:hypothetical protein
MWWRLWQLVLISRDLTMLFCYQAALQTSRVKKDRLQLQAPTFNHLDRHTWTQKSVAPSPGLQAGS